MKKLLTVMCLVSAIAVSGCSQNGEWTPMSAGRTAGEGQVVAPYKGVEVGRTAGSAEADQTFNSSLRK